MENKIRFEKCDYNSCPCCKNGLCKNITHQLGYSFYYDNTAENGEEYAKSVKVFKMQPI